MDLIPRPDQLVSAAGNLAYRVTHGGLADLRPMPRTLVDEGTLREVYHYSPAEDAEDTAAHGEPVLLVSPLAAPALCYDLRRDCSLVEHLVSHGRPTYLVEYGDVSFRDRDLAIGPWVDDVVPAAVRAVSRHAGRRPVHVVGWSVGGVFALLAAAADATLPIASVSLLGSPFDVAEVPLVAPIRPLIDPFAGQDAVSRLYRASGLESQPLLQWAVQRSTFQRFVAKPLALASNLDDADYLAQVEAVDRFTAATTAYPGRTFGQLYHRLLAGDRTGSLAEVTAPVLVFAGADDEIAPLAAVRAVIPLLTGTRETRLEIVPGGHLGMLTGRAARVGTWPVLEAWVDEWTGAPKPARRTAKKAAPKKAPAKRTTAKKAAAKKATAQPAEIGSNPERRYGSAGSRALRNPGR